MLLICKCGRQGGHSPPHVISLILVSWSCQQQVCLGHTRTRSTPGLGTWYLGNTVDVVGSESCFWTLAQSANTGLAAGRVLGKQTLRQSGVCAGCLLRVSEGPLPVRGVERGSVAGELQWGPVASANPVETAGTEMVCQHCPERVRHGPLFPSPRLGVGCTPKGHAWARQFFVAEHALKRQPCQQAAPGSGWGWFVFTMVVSW